MRFMVIAKADQDSEAGVMPSQELLTAMGKYNEELIKAGVMLAGEGLQPSSKGVRVKFHRGGLGEGPFGLRAGDLAAALHVVRVGGHRHLGPHR